LIAVVFKIKVPSGAKEEYPIFPFPTGVSLTQVLAGYLVRVKRWHSVNTQELFSLAQFGRPLHNIQPTDQKHGH
jgi:hypothetical protein